MWYLFLKWHLHFILKIFIYLAAQGLICGTWDLCCRIWDLAPAPGSGGSGREWKLVWTLNWKLEVLTIGPSGKSLKISLLLYLWLLKL